MSRCDHAPAIPDPGQAEATRLLIAHFDDRRHQPNSPFAEHPGGRECLGCGSSGPGLSSYHYSCYGGGPHLTSGCVIHDCYSVSWEYFIPWARFYRLVAPRHEGQIEMFA